MVSESIPFLGCDDRSKVQDLIVEYADEAKEDNLAELTTKLQMFFSDVLSFAAIFSSVGSLIDTTITLNETAEACNKEIESIDSSGKDMISTGFFKKVTKEERIRELTEKRKAAMKDYHYATKLVDFIINMLDQQEVPLIIFLKNYAIAQVVKEFSKQRIKSLQTEESILDIISAPYFAAATQD